eukprot:maker-scaffold2395_size16138-snap-gene-0.2 protein:Tk02132 transcript:maker-scaffold2395_size16138-snap-gene-0.2-mRNA-1 annotation:"ribonuclease h2 subunit b-like"
MNFYSLSVLLVPTLIGSARGANIFGGQYSSIVDFMRSGQMSTLPPPLFPIVPDIAAQCTATAIPIESLENGKCYELTSPKYNDPPYPSGTPGSPYICLYQIKHPTGATGAKMTILRDEFQLQASTVSTVCNRDFLRIIGISGGNSEGFPGSRNDIHFCGTLSANQEMDVDLNTHLTIAFRTNASDSDYNGWRLVLCYEDTGA